jgi:Trk K+ transport system NAD-binding subunit
VDRNELYVERARARGIAAIDGNALDDLTLERAGAGDTETLVALTSNSEVNALATHVGHDGFGIPRTYPLLSAPERGANERLLHRVGGRMAFGGPVDIRQWESEIQTNGAVVERMVPDPSWVGRRIAQLVPFDSILPLARIRGRDIEVVHADQIWAADDELVVLRRLR